MATIEATTRQEKTTRFWVSLEMSQYVSDMTPSALGILMLVIQIMLVAGAGTVELIKRKLEFVSGLWLRRTSHQHLYESQSHQENP
jgi:hypothetical protein